MQDLRRREGEYCFIRGNPNDTRLFGANSWRRVKYEKEGCFTIDEPKNWVMLDIDELEMREDERPTFEDARRRVIDEIDYVGEEDAMIRRIIGCLRLACECRLDNSFGARRPPIHH